MADFLFPNPRKLASPLSIFGKAPQPVGYKQDFGN
jgi:hypothetical protein